MVNLIVFSLHFENHRILVLHFKEKYMKMKTLLREPQLTCARKCEERWGTSLLVHAESRVNYRDACKLTVRDSSGRWVVRQCMAVYIAFTWAGSVTVQTSKHTQTVAFALHMISHVCAHVYAGR